MRRFPTSRNSGRGRGRSNAFKKKPQEKSSKEYEFYPLGILRTRSKMMCNRPLKSNLER